MKKLLVIIPIYNTEKYLRRAIESVLQQKEVDIHLALIDDASTDKSLDIINEYKDRNNVSIFVNTTNRGTYYSINRAMDLLNTSNFDFFTIHGSDDISDVYRYKTIIDEFSKDDAILGIQTSYIRLDEKYITNSTIDLSKGVYRDTGEGIAVYRRKVFDILGYYDDTRVSGDTDYWWRLKGFCSLNRDYKLSFFETSMYIATKHKDNLSTVYTNRQSYWKKISDDVKKMKQLNNFWRPKFN